MTHQVPETALLLLLLLLSLPPSPHPPKKIIIMTPRCRTLALVRMRRRTYESVTTPQSWHCRFLQLSATPALLVLTRLLIYPSIFFFQFFSNGPRTRYFPLFPLQPPRRPPSHAPLSVPKLVQPNVYSLFWSFAFSPFPSNEKFVFIPGFCTSHPY